MRIKWIRKSTDLSSAKSVSKQLNIPVPIVSVLQNRGYKKAEEIKNFLYPRLKDLPDPYGILGMEKAVLLTTEKILKKEPVAVFGDYDVDGITSTSQLLLFFRHIGHPVFYYIPHRINEGYGISLEGVKSFLSQGIKFFISVDCGIRGFDAISEIKKNNGEIIVIDHHEPDSTLPEADVIIDPKQKDCPFEFKEMAACGLVFYFLLALRRHLRNINFFKKNGIDEPDLKEFLDIVALGTVSDIVPLHSINRTLVKFGLKYINARKREAINSLIKVAGIKRREITAGHIGFLLGPRLNAGGRMDVAHTGVKLFLSKDSREISSLSKKLDELNRIRQQTEREILKNALALIEQKKEFFLKNKCIVLWDKQWHEGIIGIIASRILDEFYRPVIVFTEHGEIYKGSGRSIEGFNIVEAIKRLSHHLINFGGHKFACGLSLKKENIKRFRDSFVDLCNKEIDDEQMIKRKEVDYELSFSEITPEFIEYYKLLFPFGEGNKTPVFMTRGVNFVDVQKGYFNNGKIYFLEQNGVQVTGTVVENGGEKGEVGLKNVDIVFQIELFYFRGIESFGIKILDIL